MNLAFSRLLRDDLEKRYGDDPLSRKFIFNKEYTAARNEYILGGPEQRRTVLSVLLHEAMDDEHRDKIFPGKFDLGSRRNVAEKECTYAAVFDELYPGFDQKPDVNEPFEPVKQGIKRLTGRSVAEFLATDRLTTLKVVKLLYLISKTRPGSIFRILSQPETGKAGLEFRDAYPNAKNEELVWLVSDIREYLAAALTRGQMAETQNVFSSLLPRIEEVCSDAERPVIEKNKQAYRHLVSAYDALISVIQDFHFDIPKELAGRLDETLYTYLSSLEFRHYAQKAPEIFDFATPLITISSIARQLRDFAQTIPTSPAMYGTVFSSNARKPHECKFKVKDVPPFAHRYSGHIHSFMETALSMPVEENAVRTCIPYVKSLLGRALISVPGQVPLEDEALADLPMIVAAFCAVQAERGKRTRYQPFWHGQLPTGVSLLESLKSDFSEKSVYEEHTQIWYVRLYLFRDAINGHLEWGLRRQQLKLLILKKVAELTLLSDTEVISAQLTKFFHYVREQGRRAGS